MGIGYLAIIPILAILIVLHELGHFWAARSVGVKVEEFGLGLPPRIKGWRRDGVLWSLNALPIGGFVRVKGEDAADMEPGSMNVASPWARGWFLVAGPLMNLVTALVLGILLIGLQGVPVSDSYITIAAVEPNSPAADAGWLPGDRILSINDQKMDSTQQTISYVRSHTGEPLEVQIQRGNEIFATTVTPRTDPPAGEGSTGITFGDSRLSDVHVQSVSEGSIADKAGLRPNDEIVRIGDVEVVSLGQAVGTIDSLAGQTAKVTVLRDGQEHTVEFAVPGPSLTIREDVRADSPAGRAGLYRTDQIVAINGEPISTGNAFVNTMVALSGQEAEFSIVRTTVDGPEQMTISLAVPNLEDIRREQVPDALGLSLWQPSAFRAMGVSTVGYPLFEKVGASRIIPESWNQFTTIIGGTVSGIQQLFSGQAPLDSLMGPIGIAQFTGDYLATTPVNPAIVLLQISMFISVSLGLLNLLPIPALDGGRLLFVVLEILRGGKRIPPEKEGAVHMVGMLMLLALIAFIAFGDVSRILNGDGFFK